MGGITEPEPESNQAPIVVGTPLPMRSMNASVSPLADGTLSEHIQSLPKSLNLTNREIVEPTNWHAANKLFSVCKANTQSVIFSAQLLIGDSGHLDVRIDAVEQRVADLGEVSLDDAAGAAALPRGVAEESAWTPVQFTTGTT